MTFNSSASTFSNEQSAALFLLRDATATLREEGVVFVVMGGWAPYLFHRAHYGHPGTFDVDVLLDSASLDDGSFDRASEKLLSSGYLRAAKNNFQAHRVLRVREEELVFHVDFLNEQHPGNTIELIGGKGRLQSIYTPAMHAVFSYRKFRFTLEHGLSDVPFPSPETFIASKAAATLVAKRSRDAFDVFVTLHDQDPATLETSWAQLVASDGLFRDANDALSRALDEGDAIAKIQAVIGSLAHASIPSEAAIRSRFSFLRPR